VQRQWAEIVARAHQDVERVELDLVIMLSAMQAVEVGDPVDAEQHRFAIQDEGVGPVTQCGLDNRGYRLLQS